MKYAIWIVPLAGLVLVTELIADARPSWLTLVAVALTCSGAVLSHRVGALWKGRWEGLIREKSMSGGGEGRDTS